MARQQPRLPGSLAEVMAAPMGPHVGAFFDLDGTLVAGFTASELTKERLRRREITLPEVLRMLGAARDYRQGKLDFDQLLRGGVAPLQGQTAKRMTELGDELFTTRVADLMYPEMRELVQAHQQRGHTVVLSSSALTLQVDPVARFLGIEHVLCNRLATGADGTLTGEIVEPIIWAGGKSDAVQLFARANGVDLRRSYFYADGDEDTALMYLIGNPRPTNPGPRLAAVAKRRGWPVLRFTSRGAKGVQANARELVGTGSLLPVGAAGLMVGLATGNKRTGLNVVSRIWPQFMLEARGVKLNILGAENAEKQRPAIFLFNHRNAIDPFIAAAVVRHDYTVVAKKELAKNRFVESFGRLMDAAFVDRADGAQALGELKRIEDLTKQGLSILMAPEGTRVDTTSVAPFKKGAFRMAMAAGVPVIPIIIRNAHQIAGRKSAKVNPGTVDILVAEPIPTEDWTMAELSERVAEVRQVYVDALADWPEDTP